MRIVKIVKYQRVRYGDLEEGDEYKSIHAMSSKSANKRTGSEWDAVWANEWVTPMDTDKYPPEVTYNIEGIPERMIVETTEEGVFLDTVDLLSGDAQLAPIGDKVEETRYI